MVGTALLGAGTFPSLFAQLVFADEFELASLHFSFAGAGACERAHSRKRDESASRGAKRVCSSVFDCPQVVQFQGSPKLRTSVLW